MKKLFSLVVLSLLVVSMLGMVSAKTLIAGKIYDYNYQNTIAGADVIVTCNGNIQNATSLSDGTYTVTYNEIGNNSCEAGDSLSVYAEKDGLTGYKEGMINDEVFEGWDLAIVNVPLVPEFGFFVGMLTILSAVMVFFIVRRE